MPVGNPTLAKFFLGAGLILALSTPSMAQTAPALPPLKVSVANSEAVTLKLLEAPIASFTVDRDNQQVLVAFKGSPLLMIRDEEHLLAQEDASSTALILAEQTVAALNQLQSDHPTQPLVVTKAAGVYQVRTAEDRLLFQLPAQVQAPDGSTGQQLALNLAQQITTAFQLPEARLSAVLTAEAAATKVPSSPLEQITQRIQAFISRTFQGQASWYGGAFHGKRSASGSFFQANEMTAAHRSLPFGTQVLVTNLQNGRKVIVRVTDRGPFVGNRVLDVSRAAATALGMIQAGVARVQIDVLRLNP
ncbi:septal ring lytic transglycosylase RlpA family protein [Anthocerotibacter panamensis]|uniref:septal ring lytic transglycosylase RlpA family protein n=1 Tax=Anthocerotibacter panamensis TaxID=2857077 RepID=UPI001C4022B7|nr:septal ring lytic transglycosylase RlpA family protein [Anthocerotibacter panamensis]